MSTSAIRSRARRRCRRGSADRARASRGRRRRGRERGDRARQSSCRRAGESARRIVRTALCVEPRDGRLHVFMPPVASTPRTISTWSPRSKTPRRRSTMPVHHRRLRRRRTIRGCNHFKVTPDPGVIEVNVHPAHELGRARRDHTTTLYEEARLSRLGTEKFMLDGRHTGTGGGNHIVSAAPTPADSPFLRRPDLLRSLRRLLAQSSVAVVPVLGHVHRPDEPGTARRRSAQRFAATSWRSRSRRSPSADDVAALAGRSVFRNLLVDVTGNTHRAEFCIDKLYSPDSATGRLGLVELRAFEMPPHARMSLAQQLLLRALDRAVLERRRTTQPLVRWGTRAARPLHAAALRRAGLRRRARRSDASRLSAASPNGSRRTSSSASRCYGAVARRGVQLELRQALEPWHVLGEEAGGRRHGALRRFVGRAAAGEGDAA